MRRLSLFALLALAAPAAASDTYPFVIAEKLAIDPPPEQCSLCHSSGITGSGTVNTPFGTTARGLGLTSGEEALLEEVLDLMAAQATDSDNDGNTDIDELLAGTNPNGTTTPPLRFGCGAQVMPELVLGAALLLFRRRKHS